MIVIENLSMSYGSRTLFEIEGCISFTEGKRYGLTGPNGSGKSTLLKCIIGEVEPTSGKVALPKRVSMLKQNIEAYRDYKVRDVVIMGNDRLWKVLVERENLYEQEMTDEIGMRLGELEECVADEDGYTADTDAEELLMGMGIPEESYDEPMHTVAKDLQFKILLCQALFGNPQALLLDEPTNHLDLESITWLEDFLDHYQGTLIVVSHDRHFLNSVTTHIADIDYDTIITYNGNYDDMIFAKTSSRQSVEREQKSKEKKVQQLKEFVARFGAGSRASQVQSRLREINKLQPQDLKQSNIQRPYIRFPKPEIQPGKIVFKVEQLSKSFEDNQVINNFNLEVQRGDKIGVIGNNGMGKTTLLRMLAGVLTPDTGSIDIGHNVTVNYFPQNHEEIIDKTSTQTLYDWLNAQVSGLYEQDIRKVMGRMLFSGDDAFKQINNLSGGESARLIMASMMLKPNNIIVLDEPNNHLDLEAVSALAWGLEHFEGTAIVASHDRDLLGKVASRVISFESKGICVYNDTLEHFFNRKLNV